MKKKVDNVKDLNRWRNIYADITELFRGILVIVLNRYKKKYGLLKFSMHSILYKVTIMQIKSYRARMNADVLFPNVTLVINIKVQILEQ